MTTSRSSCGLVLLHCSNAITLEPSGHSLRPTAVSALLMPPDLKPDQDSDDLSALFLEGCRGASSLGVFACLPIFPIYFWKGENAQDVFVDLTWKCFFFSTSCFHRSFVSSNCAACHPPPPHLPRWSSHVLEWQEGIL